MYPADRCWLVYIQGGDETMQTELFTLKESRGIGAAKHESINPRKGGGTDGGRSCHPLIGKPSLEEG